MQLVFQNSVQIQELIYLGFHEIDHVFRLIIYELKGVETIRGFSVLVVLVPNSQTFCET